MGKDAAAFIGMEESRGSNSRIHDIIRVHGIIRHTSLEEDIFIFLGTAEDCGAKLQPYIEAGLERDAAADKLLPR